MAKQNTFNPVKQDVDGKKAHRMIWSSIVFSMALKGLEQGKKLIYNPFYEGNTKLIKGDLVFERTPEEIEEWKKCKNDIIYFAEKYCKLMTPKGVKHIHLRDYQKEYLKHLQDHRLSIMVSCRQAGKTTTSAIFMLWYILFNIDKNSLVLGDKRKTAIEILNKVKSIYYELPYFLKPGVYKWNENEIVLDNGCRCMAEATTPNSGISFTFHCVLADEFAKINKNIQETFYSHLFPTITAASARFMISSTVNGKDLFYRLYTAALMHENDYAPFTVTWDRVPEWNPDKECWEKRDEIWHQKQIANYGSEEAFESQFGINFDVTSNSLINRRKIQKCRASSIKFITKELPGVSLSNYIYWHPDFDPYSLRKEFVIIPIDIAEGLGSDYTVAQICRLVINQNHKVAIECVGYYRSNDVAREEVSKMLMQLTMIYTHPDHTLISLERNTYGELMESDIKQYNESDPSLSMFDIGCIVRYYNESMTKFVRGIKITPGNKSSHCLLFQEDFERDLIINNAELFVFEMENFCNDGSGHYKASFGHDDMMMSMIQLEFIKKTLQYKNLTTDFEDNESYVEDDTIYNPYDQEYIMNTPELSVMQDAYTMEQFIQYNNRYRLNGNL